MTDTNRTPGPARPGEARTRPSAPPRGPTTGGGSEAAPRSPERKTKRPVKTRPGKPAPPSSACPPGKDGARPPWAPAPAPPPAPSQAALDDPFGLLGGLGSLDLSAAMLGGLWAPPGQQAVAALVASGLAADAVFVPPGLLPEAPAPSDEPPADGRTPTKVEACETCAQCGAQMGRGTNDLEYVCTGCGLIVEGDTAEPEDDDAPRPPPNVARLRIVGPNSNQLQPDLYRSASGNTAVTQKKAILEEYRSYRLRYIEAGGRAFPLNALDLASDLYNAVQRQYVKRSQNKKAIMAACLWRACLQIDFAPAKAEVAEFMQLQTRGIARGDNFVRSLVADGKMNLDINADPCRPEIETLFTYLHYEADSYAGLREAVHAIVQTAILNNIGTSSILRSKVAGATFVVLRRCKDRELVPKPPSLQEFCHDRIRKNTVERFTRQLEAYHSYFEECYRKAGLDASPPH